MEPVTIATFNEKENAQPLVTRLERAGIQAEIHDETRLQKFYFLSENYAGIRVRVDPKDFERAKKLIETWDKQEGILRKALHCPKCGSSRVQYPQFTRQFFLPSFFLGLGMALGIIKKEFYCRECQYTWPKEIDLEPKRDPLGWPEKQAATRQTGSERSPVK